MCALFFIKKGFPFISVLEGGFAAAHSWLARDCDYLTLNQVLVDYDDKASLFADLERSYQAQKDYSNASTRRKTSLALQKLIDNSMTRLTLLENRLEEFTDRPRVRANEEQTREEDNDTSKSTGTDEMKTEVKTKNPVRKIPPMKLFQGNKSTDDSDSKDNTVESTKGLSLGEQKKNDDEGKEGQSENENIMKMKAGFGKALTGFKNIRVNRPSKVQNEDAEKKAEGGDSQQKMPMGKKDREGESNSNAQNPFNFRKMNLPRKNNFFTRKTRQASSSSKEDDDLEKEILASLTPEKSKGDDKAKEEKAKKKDGADTKSSSDNSFKNPLKKISLGKFNSIASRRPAKSSSQSIIREEELFFDENFDEDESLDGTDMIDFDVVPNKEG